MPPFLYIIYVGFHIIWLLCWHAKIWFIMNTVIALISCQWLHHTNRVIFHPLLKLQISKQSPHSLTFIYRYMQSRNHQLNSSSSAKSPLRVTRSIKQLFISDQIVQRYIPSFCSSQSCLCRIWSFNKFWHSAGIVKAFTSQLCKSQKYFYYFILYNYNLYRY